MSRKRTLLELIQSFWSRVDMTGECWLWTGEVNNKGYGFFKIYEGSGREKLLAHRFSALMAGMHVSSSDVVLHQCDTPRCVNPEHLSTGTQLDNVQDAMTKGRLNLDGLTADMDHECRECGVGFRGTPQRRFCSTLCASTNRRRRAKGYQETYLEKKRKSAEGVA